MAEHLYLVHHGIKGQHWGERNYQNKDGSLTEAGRLRYLKNDKTKTNSRRKLAEDGVIKKGTEFKRLTTNFSEKPLSNRPNWVNYKKGDADLYRSFYPKMIAEFQGRKEGTGNKAVFENTLKTTKDLKVAGGKTWKDIATKIIDDKDFSTKLALASRGITSSKPDKKLLNSDDFKNDVNLVENMKTNPKKRKMLLNQIASYQQLSQTKLSSDIFKEARNRGYDAMSDMYSVSNGETKDALILLNPKDSVEKIRTGMIYGRKGVTSYTNRRMDFLNDTKKAATAASLASIGFWTIPNPERRAKPGPLEKIASRSLVKDPNTYIKSLSDKKYDKLIKDLQSSKQKDFEEYAKKVRSGGT